MLEHIEREHKNVSLEIEDVKEFSEAMHALVEDGYLIDLARYYDPPIQDWKSQSPDSFEWLSF